MKNRAIFLNNNPIAIDNAYDAATKARICALLDLQAEVVTEEELLASNGKYADVVAAFSTWGMPALTEEQIGEHLPALQYVFYAAGSVQHFARPFLSKGVRVFSAWAANAVPVAEYTVAQIVLAAKGYFQAVRLQRGGDRDRARDYFHAQPGNYGIKVGLIGAGMIGKMVAERLQDYEYEVLVSDPFVSDEVLASLGAKRASLEEVFSTCQIVSNHVANLPATVGMINEKLLLSMLPNATFINTGRGAQVDENALIAAMKQQPDRTALLDVTFPEPPNPDSELNTLPNVFLTPHIAGSAGQEVARMGKYMLLECEKALAGQPVQYEVSFKMLETMA